jgi:hypothetical protein
MTNGEVYVSLAEALRRKIQEEGKSVEDVDFILVGGLGLHVNDFWARAEQVPWDIDKLKDEFRIVFKDRTWISKHYSHNGDVRLKYHRLFEKPVCIMLCPTPQEFMNEV